MPTGYTSRLYKGQEQTFEEFALSCAHAFGALIEMRDEPLDSEIPEFEVDDYYAEHLQNAQNRLGELVNLNADEITRRNRAAFEEKVKHYRKATKERRKLQARYEAMLAEVLMWSPPTQDHDGLKDFMLEQLRESIRFDTSYEIDEPEEVDDVTWHADEIERAQRDVEYYETEHDKAVARVAQRNEWVRALRESLKGE